MFSVFFCYETSLKEFFLQKATKIDMFRAVGIYVIKIEKVRHKTRKFNIIRQTIYVQ